MHMSSDKNMHQHYLPIAASAFLISKTTVGAMLGLSPGSPRWEGRGATADCLDLLQHAEAAQLQAGQQPQEEPAVRSQLQHRLRIVLNDIPLLCSSPFWSCLMPMDAGSG